jgi:hypothetical protein
MPKKLRPAVDLMAFKCRTLKVKHYLSDQIGGEEKGWECGTHARKDEAYGLSYQFQL